MLSNIATAVRSYAPFLLPVAGIACAAGYFIEKDAPDAPADQQGLSVLEQRRLRNLQGDVVPSAPVSMLDRNLQNPGNYKHNE